VEFIAKSAGDEKPHIDLVGMSVVAKSHEAESFYGPKQIPVVLKPASVSEMGEMFHSKLLRQKKRRRDIPVLNAPTSW